MRTLRAWAARLAGVFTKDAHGAEVREDMLAHLEMEVAEYVRRGMHPDAARRAALVASGGITQAAEAVRDQRGIPWLEHIAADFVYAIRALRRAPAFAAVVVVTLALGIGANTAIFSAVHAVLLKPLPHRDGDRLMYLRQSNAEPGGENVGFSVPEVRDLRSGARSLGQLAELSKWTVTLQRQEGAERLDVALVTGNWFDVMGLGPILGRVTGPGDDRPRAPVVVVLTYDGWVRRFGRDSSVVGRQITIDGKSATVIGVLQPAPFYPGRADALLNMAASDHHLSATMVEGRTHRMTEVVTRLAAGASIERAQAEVTAVHARRTREHPEAYATAGPSSVDVIPLKSVIAEKARLTLWLLMGAAAFVLAIAVANVANLTLMRCVRREHELAVRAALGAGVFRLRRLLLAENLLLACGGAALGSVVALSGTRLLAAMAARYTPRASEVHVDVSALLFALGVAVGVALLLSYIASLPREGCFASWVLSGGQRASAGRRRHRAQRALVVVQVAVSVVLLTGAGLLTRTMRRLSDVGTGLGTEEVLSMSVQLLSSTELLSGPAADVRAKVRFERIRAEAAALPGVTAAGLGSPAPLRASSVRFDVRVEGAAVDAGVPLPQADYRTASPEFFTAAGIPLERGRAFATTDDRGAAPVVIINRALADQLFADRNPLGQRIAWTGDVLKFTPISRGWRTVVGVVGNTRDGGLDAPARGVVYQPFAQLPALGGSLVIRADSNVAALAPTVTRIIRRVAPTGTIEDVLTIAQIRDQSVAPRRLNAMLISSFGVLALLVAAVGIAGVLAFSVGARTNEIGIRMSLGAAPYRVERMILQEGGVLVLAGLVIGLAVAYVAGGLIRGLLFGVAPHDPATLGAVTVAMAIVGLVSCWIPAGRAARIDPSITMRSA